MKVLIIQSFYDTEHVVNKMVSLTWLTWALRSVWRFTLDYITLWDILNSFVIQQNKMKGIEIELLIIIGLLIFKLIHTKHSWTGGGIHGSFIRSSLLSSLANIHVMFHSIINLLCTRYIRKRINNDLDVKMSLLCQQLLLNWIFNSSWN